MRKLQTCIHAIAESRKFDDAMMLLYDDDDDDDDDDAAIRLPYSN